ncbi:MAG: methyltransferase domain-containing protein [Burkholderiaceae bacterium]|nr:methyltransferase domain-containing protein [Burkholderiaceae bacterium]
MAPNLREAAILTHMNTVHHAAARPSVLNVGGNSKAIALPSIFNGYEHLLLDIDPKGSPDLLCDARELLTTPAAQYDAIYCSHNLEHYHRHDVTKVLAGFVHVLKPHGFAHIRVPDLMDVMKTAVARNLDLDDVLYQSPAGPIQVLDVLYGWGVEIERSGVDFFAHKTGFSRALLRKVLAAAGFQTVYTATGNLEISAIAFLRPPDQAMRKRLKLPPA